MKHNIASIVAICLLVAVVLPTGVVGAISRRKGRRGQDGHGEVTNFAEQPERGRNLVTIDHVNDHRRTKAGKSGGTCSGLTAELFELHFSNDCFFSGEGGGTTCIVDGGVNLVPFNAANSVAGTPVCCLACDVDLDEVMDECASVPAGAMAPDGAGGCINLGIHDAGIAVIVSTNQLGGFETYCCGS